MAGILLHFMRSRLIAYSDHYGPHYLLSWNGARVVRVLRGWYAVSSLMASTASSVRDQTSYFLSHRCNADAVILSPSRESRGVFSRRD